MPANDKSDPEMPGLMAFIDDYLSLFNTGGSGDSVARIKDIYLANEDFTAYDLAPPARGYIGWKEYEPNWSSLLAKFKEFNWTLNDDLRVFREGNVAWASMSGRTHGISATGEPFNKDMRCTIVMVKRDGGWKITQEHGSAPRLFELADGTQV